MLKTTKHIQAINQELHTKLNLPYTPTQDTLLNYKYGIIGNNDTDEPMYLNLVGLSIFGSPLTNNLDFIQRRQSPTDVDIPMSVPFLVKPTSTPLTPHEHSIYRCIVNRVINGTEYNLCYLKIIHPETISISQIEVNNGLSATTYVQPTDAQTPPYKQNVNLNDNTYVSASGVFSFKITTDEVNSIKDAIELLYPTYDKRIGGFGFYMSQSGTVENGNILLDTSVRYSYPLINPITLSFDIGGTIPIHTVI